MLISLHSYYYIYFYNLDKFLTVRAEIKVSCISTLDSTFRTAIGITPSLRYYLTNLHTLIFQKISF